MKGVQCYELFGGIALKNHAFSFTIRMLRYIYQAQGMFYHSSFRYRLNISFMYMNTFHADDQDKNILMEPGFEPTIFCTHKLTFRANWSCG